MKPGQRIEVPNNVDLLPLQHPARFSVYRQGKLKLAPGDLVQVTANGKTKDQHRLNNGNVFEVKGFTKAGDIELTNGWVVAKEIRTPGTWVSFHQLRQSGQHETTGADRSVVAIRSCFGNQTQAYVKPRRVAGKMAVVLTDSKEAPQEASGRDDRRIQRLRISHGSNA